MLFVKNIFNCFNKIKRSSHNSEIYRKETLINIFVIIALLYIIVYGLNTLIVENNRFIASINFTAAFLLILSFVFLKITDKINLFTYVIIIIMIMMFFALFSTGGVNNKGYLWSYTVPLFVMYLLSFPWGIIITFLYFTLLCASLFIPDFPMLYTTYDPYFKRIFIGSFGAVFFLTGIYEVVLCKTYQIISQKNDELGQLLEERKQALDSLKEVEKNYHNMIEHSHDTIVLMQDNIIKHVNSSAVRLLGYTVEEFKDTPFINYIHPDEHENMMKYYSHHISHPNNNDIFETAFWHKDGHKVYVEISGGLISYHGEPAFIGFARDISERKLAFEKLLASEEKYRLLAENAPLGIIKIDAEGNITDLNNKLLEIFGSESAEATKSINILTFPLLVKSGVSADFINCFETGQLTTSSHPYTSKWGKKSHLRYHLAPVKNHNDEIIGVQGVIEDITEQKRMEEQLHIRQRMESIGTLAGGMAHDFNNLLTGIIGNISILDMEGDNFSEDQKRCVQDAYDTSQKASALMKEIQNLSTGAYAEKTSVDIFNVADYVFKILKRTSDKAIDMKIGVLPNQFIITANKDQLHQVLLNLGTNSVYAIEDRGVATGDFIKITAEKYNVDKQTPPGLPPGEYVHILFEDNGKGMTSEIKSKAFDPLFTTRGRGTQKGQGLGLAMAYNIITRYHDGHIDIESTEGKGTIIHIFLPQGNNVQESAKEFVKGSER